MLKQEVIIIACACQQIIHILSNNNEKRNVDELGVIVKSLEPATLSAGASQPFIIIIIIDIYTTKGVNTNTKKTKNERE